MVYTKKGNLNYNVGPHLNCTNSDRLIIEEVRNKYQIWAGKTAMEETFGKSRLKLKNSVEIMKDLCSN
jgi:hypothetical protein